MTPEEITKKEQELASREANLKQKEIEMTASEAEHFKAMADLKEEKLMYQSLQGELHQQKALLIQLCEDIEFEFE